MRVIVDAKEFLASVGLPDPDKIRITQVEKTPAQADGTAINGRFVVPVIEGVDFSVTSSSSVWPISNNESVGAVIDPDINSQSFAYLLASFPMYGYLFFNPFLTEEDISGAPSVGGVDFTKTFRFNGTTPPEYWPVRIQTGREVGVPLPGLMPTHTALLPLNANVTGASVGHPGLLITQEIDISAYTGPAGADDFMVYWRLLDFTLTDDIASDYGATAGRNEPAIRYVKETDQEPAGLQVMLSTDDGLHWCSAGRLEPVAFAARTTKVRIAFLNFGASKIYLANWALLF